ncbi:MAG: sugar-binding domain-containing protein, partial [Planctomycetes bacterium]|nr:sugar-binding domain-containing protein [Planctomycetota bacterium]
YVEGQELEKVAEYGRVGEVLGRFFDINGNTFVKDINELHISINLPAKCRLIGVAGGLEKVKPIVGALRTGWLKGLITDESAAKAVVRALSRDAKRTDKT